MKSISFNQYLATLFTGALVIAACIAICVWLLIRMSLQENELYFYIEQAAKCSVAAHVSQGRYFIYGDPKEAATEIKRSGISVVKDFPTESESGRLYLKIFNEAMRNEVRNQKIVPKPEDQ